MHDDRLRVTTNGGTRLHARPLSMADAQALVLKYCTRIPVYVRSVDDRIFVMQIHPDQGITYHRHGTALTDLHWWPWAESLTIAIHRAVRFPATTIQGATPA